MSRPLMDMPNPHQEDAGEEKDIVNVIGSRDNDEQEQQRPAQSLWQAVQQLREASDLQAATDAIAMSRRRRNKWAALLFGQVVAFIAASVNVTSFILENDYGVVAPMSQLFVMYTFLSLHMFFRSRQAQNQDNNDDRETIHYYEYRIPLLGCMGRLRLLIPWYLYFFMSCMDVGAGVIMLLSLQYTSLTSVTLLSSLSVPSTMLFSKVLLDKSFYCHHFVGVCLCLLGGCLTVWSDLENDHDQVADDFNNNGDATMTTAKSFSLSLQNWGMNIGDLMALTAALIYGLGDALSEYSIKHVDRCEFLGMLGVFGMILTGLQFPFQEGGVLSQLLSDPGAHYKALGLMGCYISLLLLYYVTEAYFLVSSDATLLNLSLQAQNLWAILFSVVTYQSGPQLIFYLAVALVAFGVFTYEVGGPSSDRAMHLISTLSEEGRQNETSTSGVPNDGSQRKRGQGSVQYSTIEQIEIV